MKKLLFLVASISFAQNTAIFPGGRASNIDLPIAKDRAQTTLSGGINSSVTSITVASIASFPTTSAFIVTIDNEQIRVCSAASTTFTVCDGGRGFGGTSAASHSNGATVRMNFTAWHQNQVNAEIQAIEAAVGDNQSYNFSRTKGTFLSADLDSAGSKTLTFSALCPFGVAGANTNHYLKISGGSSPVSKTISAATNATPIAITTTTAHGFSTGNFVVISGVAGNTAANGQWLIVVTGAQTFTLNSSTGNAAYTSGGTVSRDMETALITGGTCTSGLMAGGTITLTTVNPHVGSYVLASATSGIQEEINASGNYATAKMQCGLISTYATVYVPDFRSLAGCDGSRSSVIVPQFSTADAVNHVQGSPFSGNFYSALSNFSVAAVLVMQSGTALIRVENGTILADNLLTYSGNIGMEFLNTNIKATNLESLGSVTTGVLLQGIAGNITNLNVDNADVVAGQAVQIVAPTTGLTITNMFLQKGLHGIAFICSSSFLNEIVLDGGFIDNYGTGATSGGAGVFVDPNSCTTNYVSISNMSIAGGNATNGYGIFSQDPHLTGGLANVHLENNRIHGSSIGVFIQRANGWTVKNNEITVANATGVGVYVDESSNGILVGNNIGWDFYGAGATALFAGSQVANYGIQTTAAAFNSWVIAANRVYGFAAPTLIAGTGIGNIIAGNVGLPNVTQHAYGTPPTAYVELKGARGTSAAPTAVQSGDVFGGVVAGGYGASSYPANTASMRALATENFTNTANGTELEFATTPNGSITRVVRMKLPHNGGMLPSAIVHGSLPSSPTNGTLVYCSDCAVTSGADNTCNSGGTGAMAFRLNGAWRCFAAQN